MQRVRLSATAGLASVGVVQLLLLLLAPLLEVAKSDRGSGSGCAGVDQILPLFPPTSSPHQASGLFLSPLAPCVTSGCVSGWSYCYYSLSDNEEHSVEVTFALWRWSRSGMLEEVGGSRFEVVMKTLPEDQWLVCEERDLRRGCGVEMEEGDMVGVVIKGNTSLHVLGEVEGGLVMVGGKEEGEEGSVSNASLVSQPNLSLLVSPVLRADSCSPRLSTTEEMCSSPAPSPQPSASPPTTATPADELPSPSGRRPDLVLVVVAAGLSLLVLVLLTLLSLFLCVSCRRGRFLKQSAQPTVLLNSHRRNSENGAELGFDMHVLDTASSTHSNSLSPTPNGQARVWQLPPHRKAPPPIKPKPPHLSSRKTAPPPQPQATEVEGQTPPPVQEGVVTEPAHHASLLRSHSDEAFQLQPSPRERPQLRPPNSPRLQRRLSTGSLPTPCLDEDDYTIPNPSLRRAHLRPQPYLQPKSLEYSYAYSHVLAGAVTGGFCTVPRGRPVPLASSHPQPLSGNSNSPKVPAPEDFSDYDEIFVDKYWREQSQLSHTPSSAGHTSTTQPPSSISSGVLSEQPRLMSTASEGYMNSDEFPRPLNPSPEQPRPLQRYTPLKPSLRRLSSTYEVPRGSSSDVPPSTEYDHLNSDLLIGSPKS